MNKYITNQTDYIKETIKNMTTTIKFAKVKENATIPSKSSGNAGYDIYACFDEDYMIIEPHTTELIPTGLASACDEDYYFQIEERGSTGSKGIKKSAGVIDSNYRGEWFIAITNASENIIFITKKTPKETFVQYLKDSKNYSPQELEECVSDIESGEFNLSDINLIFYPYTKAIAQAVLLPVPKTVIEEITYDELKKITSDRGEGCLGSSGK